MNAAPMLTIQKICVIVAMTRCTLQPRLPGTGGYSHWRLGPPEYGW